MHNPNLELTIITKLDSHSATYFENRILDESKINTDWNSFKIDLKDCKHEYDRKEIVPLLIPVSWKTKGFDSVKDKDGKEILVNGKTVARRCSENIDSWFMLPLDIDDYLTLEKAKELYKKYEYIGYTTFNHSLHKNKYRLLFPLSKSITHSEYIKKKSAITKFINVADPVSMSAAQGFYLPSCHAENREVSTIWHHSGTFIDLHTFPNDKATVRNTEKSVDKQWYVDKKPNLSDNTSAADYLHNFIRNQPSFRGDHKDCVRLHSILKAFGVEEHKHIDIVTTFRSYETKHNVKQNYKSVSSLYGGIGSLINLLKSFQVNERFDIYKFKMLAGLIKKKTVMKVLKSSSPLEEEEFVLDGEVISSVKRVENGLVFVDETKSNTVGDVISDDSFPLGVTILNSPTNTGKTYLFKHILKSPRILIAPTKALVDQIVAGDNSIAKCYGQMKFPIGSQVIAMTYDKIKNYMALVRKGAIKQYYDLYVDEAHNLYSSYSFRYRTMETVYKSIRELYFRKVVLMSGTMRDEFLPNLKVDKKITITKKNQAQQKCCIVKTNGWVKYIRDNIDNTSLTLILLNDKKEGGVLSSRLERDGYRVQLFNADNQNESINQEMLTNECVRDDIDVLIFTSIGVEGLNINNFKIDMIFAVGHHPSAILEQLKNRARRSRPKLVVLKSVNSDEDGYIRGFNFDSRNASAKKYIEFANMEMRHTKDDKKKAMAKTLLSSVKSLPSDLRYTVGFDHETQMFFVSDLGIAAYLYDVDCTNEAHNSDLFELHMKNYNFSISRESVILEDHETKDLIVEAKKLKEEDKKNLLNRYKKLMSDPSNTIEKLRYSAEVINNNGKDPNYGNKVEGIEELEGISDLIIKSSILSKYYSYEDLQDIIIGYIKDSNIFDMAKDYGEQIRDKAWIRPKLEGEFKLDHWYSIHEVRSKLKLIEELARSDIKADFNGLGSDIALSNYLHRMFSVNKKRKTKNGKKVMSYCIKSYNPIGKRVITESYSSGDLLVMTQTSPVPPKSFDDDYQILKTASL